MQCADQLFQMDVDVCWLLVAGCCKKIDVCVVKKRSSRNENRHKDCESVQWWSVCLSVGGLAFYSWREEGRHSSYGTVI